MLPFSCCFAHVYSTFLVVITCEMTKTRLQCANEKARTRTNKGALARHRFSKRRYSTGGTPPPTPTLAATQTLGLASFHAGRRRCRCGPSTVTEGSCRHCYRRSFLLGLPAASLLFSAGRVKQVLPAALTTDSSFLPLAATVSPPSPRHKGRRLRCVGGRCTMASRRTSPIEPFFFIRARDIYEGKIALYKGGGRGQGSTWGFLAVGGGRYNTAEHTENQSA